MHGEGADTEKLIQRASQGDKAASHDLLIRHQDRLLKMVAVHLDRRVARRIDPADVVQEALVDAARKLSDYVRDRPLPFYPWLRQIAWEHLVKAHNKHLRAQKHSVAREEPGGIQLPEESAVQLANRLVSRGSSPSRHVLREELRGQV